MLSTSLAACRPFEPVDKRRGLVWFRMEREGNGKKFSLIDTKVEAALLVAERKKVLSFDYEIRCVRSARGCCAGRGWPGRVRSFVRACVCVCVRVCVRALFVAWFGCVILRGLFACAVPAVFE